MRMRIALSILAVAVGTAIALGGNVTAASATTSSLSSMTGDAGCC